LLSTTTILVSGKEDIYCQVKIRGGDGVEVLLVSTA